MTALGFRVEGLGFKLSPQEKNLGSTVFEALHTGFSQGLVSGFNVDGGCTQSLSLAPVLHLRTDSVPGRPQCAIDDGVIINGTLGSTWPNNIPSQAQKPN